MSITLSARAQIDLSSIGRIERTPHIYRANDLLRLEWILLALETVDRGDPDRINQDTAFVLGWPREKGSPQLPEWLAREDKQIAALREEYG